MTIQGIANAEQSAALTKVLDEYYEQVGLERTHPAREMLARRLVELSITASKASTTSGRHRRGKPKRSREDAPALDPSQRS